MKLILKKHLLLIDYPELPKLKEYVYNFGGFFFSSEDNGILVVHKKQIKIVHLKTLGDGMEVIYFGKKNNLIFDPQSFHHAFFLHQGFDEDIGSTYGFFPGISPARRDELNSILATHTISQSLELGVKGMITSMVSPNIECFQTPSQVLSYLYGLILLYGKLEHKPGDLRAVKAHIPLFGQAANVYGISLEKGIKLLAEHGLFFKVDIVPAKTGSIFQISSSDWEILSILADWHKALENLTQITKCDLAFQLRAMVVSFLMSDLQVPQEGRDEIFALFEDPYTTVKFLAKEK